MISPIRTSPFRVLFFVLLILHGVAAGNLQQPHMMNLHLFFLFSAFFRILREEIAQKPCGFFGSDLFKHRTDLLWGNFLLYSTLVEYKSQ